MSDAASIEAHSLPPSLGGQFQRMLGLDEAPRTLGDWLDDVAAVFAAADVTIGVDEMCLEMRSRHSARIDGSTQHFACVLDALLVPHLLDEPGTVTVESESPVRHDTVVLEATTDTVRAEPSTAVVSFGAAEDAELPDDVEGMIDRGTAVFCPYVNAFPDRAAYEQWDEGSPEAVTMPLEVEEAHTLAAGIAERRGGSIGDGVGCDC